MTSLHAVIASMLSATLVAAPAQPQPEQPVPVQRPSGLREAPPPEPEPAPEPEPEPEPAPQPEAAPAPQPEPRAPEPRAVETRVAPETTEGRIEGVVVDTETEGAPVSGASIELVCPCLREAQVTVSDIEGRFEFEALPAGEYTLLVDRGGPVTRSHVSLPEGAKRRTRLQVAPPTTTEELEDRAREMGRAKTMISIGSVSAVAAVLMFIGAGVEAAKPDCNFGLDDCSDAPRRNMTAGLGIGGAILAAGGGTLILLGVRRLRRVRARIELDDQSAAVVLSGRF